MTGDALASWRAAHMFVGHDRHLDVLAVESQTVLIDLAADPYDWFFIRYTEGGLHLRLRCGPGAAEAFDAIIARLRPICAALAGELITPTPSISSLPTAAGRIYDPGSLELIDYVPETIRYGGPHGLAVNERLFRVSTLVAANLVSRTELGSVARMTQAIDLLLATIASFTQLTDPRKFLTDYAESWRREWSAPSSDAIAERSGTSLSARYVVHLEPTVEQRPARTLSEIWRRDCTEARHRFRELHQLGLLVSPVTGLPTRSTKEFDLAMASMAHSQIHMTNNRLGLWPPYEIMLAERILAQMGHE